MRNTTESVRQQIVAMYEAGERIDAIEKQLGVTRSSIYYALKQANVAPSRAKVSMRLRGSHVELAELYATLEAYESRVRQLEQFIVDAGLQVPEVTQ